jgi:predicted metal-dependent hydrolase
MATRELLSRDRHRLVLGTDSVEYTLVRRRGRRGVGLKVDETGLTVSAPATMPHAKIEGLVRESERWVLRKIAEWQSRQVPPVTWHDGSPFPYLGRTLILRLSVGRRGSAERLGEELRVTVRATDEAEVRRVVAGWYKRAAAAYLGDRVAALAAAAAIAPPKFLVSPAMARWGSCNTRREVRLAWRLVKAPAELIDYVICHELAHLRQMNHSPAFWAEVARQCPDYRRLRDELFATDHLYRAF